MKGDDMYGNVTPVSGSNEDPEKLRKAAEDELANREDTATLADPWVLDELIRTGS